MHLHVYGTEFWFLLVTTGLILLSNYTLHYTCTSFVVLCRSLIVCTVYVPLRSFKDYMMNICKNVHGEIAIQNLNYVGACLK